MPATGARFAIAQFNLPAINTPCPHGIFVFLVDNAQIVASTSLDKNPL
jgi:hypothetical protein